MRTLYAVAVFALWQYLGFAIAQVATVNPIGNGVVVNASIFYDDKYAAWHKEKKPDLDISEDLRNVVFLAQEYFRNNSIMVNFSILTVENRSDYLVKLNNKSIDGKKTLQNMTTFALSRQAPNNSIYYHFSGYRIQTDLEANISQSYGVSGIATNGTFCTQPSAAILVYYPGSNNSRAFVNITAITFGVTGGIHFTDTDKETMNATFAKCATSKKARRQESPKGKRKDKGTGKNTSKDKKKQTNQKRNQKTVRKN
uniref:28 kDa Metastriate family member n=1 Tax=Rhipicephalus appendiculatus TaxID=34631 RepID=A0A131Z6M5_RHIAP